MEASCRLRSLFKTLTSYSSQLQRLRPFSSSAAASHRDWGFYTDDTEDSKESAVYKHVLKSQRPSTIERQGKLLNTADFIGTVDSPPKIMNTRNGRFGVYTSLKVKPSRDSNRFFWISLRMWDNIAEISFKYLKPNDFIYVSGCLESYPKVDENGKLRTKYNVNVTKINYVAQHGKVNTCLEAEQSGSTDQIESALEKRRNRLHLWQVFFTNPYDWWDNRKCKPNPRGPDFKHKSTGEVLWLSPHNDPPWIRKELQRHDSRLAEMGLADGLDYRSSVSPMEYDELRGVW